MKIEHVAIWTKDIEKSRLFYENYFGAKSNTKYSNNEKAFSSYFLSFDSGARLEIMQMDSVSDSSVDPDTHYYGFAHLAISVGSKNAVDQLTSKIKSDGYSVLSDPRLTGDGYYESIVLDPDGNKLEITI
ncbi:MAG: VOC family protein [Candidatus Zixiibacteriota bacterium]